MERLEPRGVGSDERALADGLGVAMRRMGIRGICAVGGAMMLFALSAMALVSPAGAASKPGRPTITTATAGDGLGCVQWSPPASDGGTPIVVYVVTAYVGFAPSVSVL